jgi:hypothetical protein
MIASDFVPEGIPVTCSGGLTCCPWQVYLEGMLPLAEKLELVTANFDWAVTDVAIAVIVNKTKV